MNRLVLLAVFAVLLSCVACGDIFVRGAINPGFQSTSGTVSVVQLSASSGSGKFLLAAAFETGSNRVPSAIRRPRMIGFPP